MVPDPLSDTTDAIREAMHEASSNGQEPEHVLKARPSLVAPVERVVESDRLLIVRMESELIAAQRLQQFVNTHLTATYDLHQGDRIESDGRIVRGAAS